MASKYDGLVMLADGSAAKLLAEEFRNDMPKRFSVQTETGDNFWADKTDIMYDMTKDNAPSLFYRITVHQSFSDGSAIYRCWVGPNWGNSAGNIMLHWAYGHEEMQRIKNLFHTWCQAERGVPGE